MDYATPSEPLLRLALASGIAVFVLALSLVAAIAALRAFSDLRSRREDQLSAQWLPVFHHAIEGLPLPPLPPLLPRDRPAVLGIWIRLHESVRGRAHQNLRTLALVAHAHRDSVAVLPCAAALCCTHQCSLKAGSRIGSGLRCVVGAEGSLFRDWRISLQLVRECWGEAPLLRAFDLHRLPATAGIDC